MNHSVTYLQSHIDAQLSSSVFEGISSDHLRHPKRLFVESYDDEVNSHRPITQRQIVVAGVQPSIVKQICIDHRLSKEATAEVEVFSKVVI